MAWMDDLQARVTQAAESVAGDWSDYLKSKVDSQVVKLGPPRAGNLSAAEIAAGARGAPPDQLPSEPVKAMGAVASKAALSMPIVFAILGAAYLIFKRK